MKSVFYAIPRNSSMTPKVVIITGVSSGLGQALAQKFLNRGHFVIGFSRRQPDFPTSLHISGDVTSAQDRENLVERTLQNFGRIDILINNAGIGIYETWQDMNLKDLRSVFELNFFSGFALTQAALPSLIKSKGQIVNLGSIAGKTYMPYMGGYCASKFALDAFSRTLHTELKPYGINVLTLTVGRVGTGFGKRALGTKKHPSSPSSTPELFARKVYLAIQRRRKELFFPRWYKWFLRLSRWLPSLVETLALKKWQRMNP